MLAKEGGGDVFINLRGPHQAFEVCLSIPSLRLLLTNTLFRNSTLTAHSTTRAAESLFLSVMLLSGSMIPTVFVAEVSPKCSLANWPVKSNAARAEISRTNFTHKPRPLVAYTASGLWLVASSIIMQSRTGKLPFRTSIPSPDIHAVLSRPVHPTRSSLKRSGTALKFSPIKRKKSVGGL